MMDMSRFDGAMEDVVIAYVVHNENALGYLFKVGESFVLGLLATTGGVGRSLDENDNHIMHEKDYPLLRDATVEDFNKFRVHPVGHIL